MRFSFVFLIGISLISFGQDKKVKKDSILLPDWQVSLDLINYVDHYPAILLGAEKTITNELAVKGEIGPVIEPETFDLSSGRNQFTSYFGYKSRFELRFYSQPNVKKFKRKYFAFDVFLQQDFFENEILVSRLGFEQLVDQKFNRTVLGSHVRLGSEKYFEKAKVSIGWSVGIGRMIFLFSDEEAASNSDITDFGALGPLSLNLRLSLGFVLSNKQEKIF